MLIVDEFLTPLDMFKTGAMDPMLCHEHGKPKNKYNPYTL
jgi:hypothetical protein